MTFFLLSMVLVAATISVARPAMAGQKRIPVAGVTGSHVIVLLAVMTFVALAFGPASSLALLIAHNMHELGLVIGYRLAGHRSVRFRLLPTPRAGPVSPEPHDSDLGAFFVGLFAPAFALAPMVAAFALADLTVGTALQPLFGALALFIGAYNFVALLPIWPLPGGHLVRLLLRPQVQRVSPLPAAAFLAGLMSLSWAFEAPLLFVLALVGALAYALQPPLDEGRAPLSLRQIALGVAAYLATLGAFFLGGWWVILLIAGNGTLPQ